MTPTRLVIADTGPLNYLILIDAVGVLPGLFAQVILPVAVYDELTHPRAPEPVRTFAAHRPEWLAVRPNHVLPNDAAVSSASGKGEWAAIALAVQIGADLVLMDDRAGVDVAYSHGLAVIGTLGVLELAAQLGLVELEAAFARLRDTNFRYPADLMDAMLARYRAEKS